MLTLHLIFITCIRSFDNLRTMVLNVIPLILGTADEDVPHGKR